MLRHGPIPRVVHGAVEYALVAVFLAAPFVLDFDSDPATALAVVVGVATLVIAATTDAPTSLVDVIPVTIHVVLDFLIGALLIAAPFLFGFSDESAPTAFFIVLGVGGLLLTIGTRFLPAPARA